MTITEEEWTLTDDERQAMVQRTATGIASICFFSGKGVTDEVAAAAAATAEEKAFARAQIESKTTTGSRPRKEVQRAYIRILSENLLQCVASGCDGAEAAQHGMQPDSNAVDVSGSGREFVTATMAEKLFAPMLKEGTSVSAMKLSTKSIGADSAPVVVRAIANCKGSLTHADISDIIAGRPEAEVLQVLRQVSDALASCKLAHLDLSDNALGEKGVRACAAAMTSQPELRGLHLKNIGCSVAACAAVNELVQCSTLQVLRLHNNMSGDEGAGAIAELVSRNNGMQEFQMSASRVGIDGGTALVAALAQGTALQALDLTGNPMAPELVQPLKPLLQRAGHLTCLILSDLNLGPDGSAGVAEVLADPGVAPQLRVLDLSQNEINSEATPAVARAAAAHAGTLQRLVLSDNELECVGAIHIASGLRRAAALQELDLRTNMIGRVGAQELARVLCSHGAAAALRCVELDDNQIAAEGVEAITEMFEAAFPAKAVLGSLEENDEEGDPGDDDVLDSARAEVSGIDERADELDLSKLTI